MIDAIICSARIQPAGKTDAVKEKIPHRRSACAGFSMCAEHAQQLGGESPLSSLMVAKD
jgi:hypothetical protein